MLPKGCSTISRRRSTIAMVDGHAAQVRSCWRQRGVLQVCNADHIPTLVPPLVALAIVSAWSPRESSAPDLSTANPTKEDFAKQIDIGGGRKLYLECHGTGSPTVILESGYQDSAQPWSLSDRSYAQTLVKAAVAVPGLCSIPTHRGSRAAVLRC